MSTWRLGLAVGVVGWLAASAAARPLEYYTTWVAPDGTARTVGFEGRVEGGVIAGVVTVGDDAFDVAGTAERSGRVFVAISRPGGATVATFDGDRAADGTVAGEVVRLGATRGVPVRVPVALRAEDLSQ